MYVPMKAHRRSSLMMKLEQIQEAIRQGEAVCGIELGSTRIKAVLILSLIHI